MRVILEAIFFINLFIIFWAMIGYPLSILILEKILKPKDNYLNFKNLPSVTVLVVAHNEEKVIFDKLMNLSKINYPVDKLEILVASDNSTDRTNEIVQNYIESNPTQNISLYQAMERKGKTSAQNEAIRVVKTEYVVFTDANSMLDENAVTQLMASFSNENICYVAGILIYTNDNENLTSSSESSYWSLDLRIRDIESKLQTITAGNGALYACRTHEYVDFNPIVSHDTAMPLYFGLSGKRAISNKNAIAYEKAGENISDEFGRKVRMNRGILKNILPDIRLLNFFRYKWFSYFYFGHRTTRYLLWIAHLLLLVSNFMLVPYSLLYLVVFLIHFVVYLAAVFQYFVKTSNKLLVMLNYYLATIIAQWIGVYNIATGKTKPFWEKAESTR